MKLLIVAGEPSGDLHGSNLVKAIKEINPKIDFIGLGGSRMLQAGVHIYHPIAEHPVLGLVEVLERYGEFKKIFDELVGKLDRERPDAVILVDYPGFNMRFAKEVKKRDIPLIYYISPQVWAWGAERIALIKRLVNLMVVIFKFEEELYKKHGIDAEFVGHPLIDLVKIVSSKEKLLEALGLSKDKKTVSILPGSRENEVRKHLPVLLDAAKLLAEKIPHIQFILIKAPNLGRRIYDFYLANFEPAIRIVEGKNYDCLNASELALVSSGTATLETALVGVPMVIIYKVSFFTWLISLFIIKIPYIGLVNVVAGKKIVPEFLQYQAQPNSIAKEALLVLADEERRNEIKAELARVKEKLGGSGASHRAAEVITDYLQRLKR